jgi:CXXX repeat peptide maturase
MTQFSWIVLVDEAAVSYCYYENYRYLPGPSRPMSQEMLKAVVSRARAAETPLQFVLGNEPLPAEHYALMDQVPHVKVLPLGSKHDIQDGIFVVGREDYRRLEDIEEGSRCTLNLRLERDCLPAMATLVETALVRSARVNVMLLNLELYQEENLIEYREQLQMLAVFLEERYRQRDFVECNLVAAGPSVQKGRDCGAGVTHLTIAPDGKFYVCPGFFYDGLGRPCGDLQSGACVPNAPLYARDHAPLCSTCAVGHCPRCVYLNKKTTAEVNTPSQQQCVTAHLEHQASVRLSERLRAGDRRAGLGRPRLDFQSLDPFLRSQPGQDEGGTLEPRAFVDDGTVPASRFENLEDPTRRSSS